MAEPAPGDLLAIMTAGAYGAVQAGTYNTRALVPEVLVNGRRMGAGAAAARRRRLDRDGSDAQLALGARFARDRAPHKPFRLWPKRNIAA